MALIYDLIQLLQFVYEMKLKVRDSMNFYIIDDNLKIELYQFIFPSFSVRSTRYEFH